jgi:hypothetical protein
MRLRLLNGLRQKDFRATKEPRPARPGFFCSAEIRPAHERSEYLVLHHLARSRGNSPCSSRNGFPRYDCVGEGLVEILACEALGVGFYLLAHGSELV